MGLLLAALMALGIGRGAEAGMTADGPAPTLFLVGDSTMAVQLEERHPEQGWGQALPPHLANGIRLQNHAMNGRSTKRFRDEGRWQAVLDELKAGDWVVIGFGHNDQKIEDPARYAEAWTDFRANLGRYVDEAQAKGAEVILLTSVPRRSFSADGDLVETLGDYPAVTRLVARDKQVPLVDMNQLVGALVQRAGEVGSRELYMHAEPGQFPTLPPEGKQDDTHFQQAGAEAVAGLFAAEVKRQKLALAAWLVSP
jgi:lysophospholipase L1-like esterase